VNSYVLSMVLLASSIALYQIAQKYVPKGLSAWSTLAWAYLVALVICLFAAFLDKNDKGMLETFKNSNWAVWAVGLTVVGIELGFLLALRAGWKLAGSGLIANTFALLISVPVALFLVREKWSLLNFSGLVLCIVGLFLVTRK
jgi:uncharacterized membrane protein